MARAPGDGGAAAVRRAKARLDGLDLYPRPVRIARVRVWVAPWVFRLPWFRRFDGYTMWSIILLREPLGPGGSSEDLLTHELCHVWQMQHRPVKMPLSYLVRGYEGNPYEVQARAAVTVTRQLPQSTSSASSASE